MRLTKTEILLAKRPFAESREWSACRSEIELAVKAVVWPTGSSRFIICPDRGRGRGEGNGVVPIKLAFLKRLAQSGWSIDERRNPLRFDAFKDLRDRKGIGLEWETGNISSSHRSVNRILRAHLDGTLIAGVLVLPTRNMYQYLTDRVGNFEELEPYFPIWSQYPWNDGVLAIFAVEHDGVDPSVPRIGKGTDGRALL
jgi:hypothetical protein